MATADATTTTCYRHRDRETGVSCSSCGRPICTECMTSTPVGMRCPECSRQTTKVRNLASTRGQATLTRVFIAVNVAVWLAMLLTGSTLFQPAGVIAELGVLQGAAIAEGDWWRVVTGGFLHASIFHLLLNSYFIYIMGELLEPGIGKLRFGIIYGVALLGGSLGALLLTDPLRPTLGASGAAFGLLAAGIIGLRARGISPMQSGLGPVLLLNLAITFLIPGISIGGHLGGLAAGLVVGWLLLDAPPRLGAKAPLALSVGLGVACAVGAVLLAGSI